MAENMVLQVVVSPLLEVLFHNLSSMIKKEFGLQLGVDKKMRKLSDTLSTILSVLEDAEENQLTNKMIGKWLQKLKDAAYDAEDFLDEWAVDAGVGHKSSTKQVSHSIFTHLEQKLFRRKSLKKINKLLEKFDEIAAERLKFHLRNDDVVRKVELYPNRETSSFITESKIYGRDEDKECILARLLNNKNSEEDLSVCPIVGMGGLGKTTLAQWVYNDEKVKDHFDVRAWVCVSDDFNVKRLTKAILDSVSGGTSGDKELDLLQRTLQGKLAGKRFLLVLDDVWNEDQDEWDRLQCSLKGGAKGSSVVVTTRLKKVASVTGTGPHHSLKLLSEEDCWLLFKQRAFGVRKEEIPKFVQIGKEIVQKCGGVPLAAKVLGSLMSSKVTESQWKAVRNCEIWTPQQSGTNTILPALRLSYTHLSPVLRQCFAYCSIYPKDFQMEKQHVIELWMANGLIPSSEGLHEEVGNEIFDALVQTSFIQEGRKDWYGNVMRFTMHDLIHDLACFVMINECARVDDEKQIRNIHEGIRHLSILNSSPTINQSIHKLTPKLRTFLAQNCYHASFDISSFACIRAISAENCGLTTVADSVGDLKHLRYLNLSKNRRIISLPESICRLRNLESLRLKDCADLQKLPEGLRKITSLRHLDIGGCQELCQMPIGMGALTCLRTLSTFIVGQDDGRHIKELKELDHLSGEIEIWKLENVTDVNDAKEANLMRKENLQHLKLIWSDTHLEDENDRDILEALEPHSDIKSLDIQQYQGITFPSWMDVSSLPNLVGIFLYRCDTCKQLPSFGKLPQLKFLFLYGMRSVKFFGNPHDVRNGFPSLEDLRLLEMDALQDWSSSSLVTGDSSGSEAEQVILFPSLKSLEIKNCPMLKRLPFPASLQCSHHTNLPLKKLSISACPALNLSTLQFQLFVALKEFNIAELPDLKSLPELSCELVNLRLYGLSSLMLLPDWIGSLTSLRKMSIENCTNIKELPERLKHLDNLHRLWMAGCSSDLMSRCSKETGEDWHKIAHIPDIRINYCRL